MASLHRHAPQAELLKQEGKAAAHGMGGSRVVQTAKVGPSSVKIATHYNHSSVFELSFTFLLHHRILLIVAHARAHGSFHQGQGKSGKDQQRMQKGQVQNLRATRGRSNAQRKSNERD